MTTVSQLLAPCLFCLDGGWCNNLVAQDWRWRRDGLAQVWQVLDEPADEPAESEVDQRRHLWKFYGSER
jgi:hypothetical protein